MGYGGNLGKCSWVFGVFGWLWIDMWGALGCFVSECVSYFVWKCGDFLGVWISLCFTGI